MDLGYFTSLFVKIWDQPAASLIRNFEDIWAPHCQCEEESLSRDLSLETLVTQWDLSVLSGNEIIIWSLRMTCL